MKSTGLNIHQHLPRWALALALLMGLAACGESTPEPKSNNPAAPLPADATDANAASKPAPPAVVAGELGTVRNLHIAGDVYLAGQPQTGDFPLIAEAGVKRVINLRLPEETAELGEEKRVTDSGMAYHALGFRSPESLTDDIFDQSRQVLRDAAAADEKVLMHCGSANRAGAVWLTYRVLDQGVGIDAAIDEAHTVGLSNADYERIALQYIKAQLKENQPSDQSSD